MGKKSSARRLSNTAKRKRLGQIRLTQRFWVWPEHEAEAREAAKEVKDEWEAAIPDDSEYLPPKDQT